MRVVVVIVSFNTRELLRQRLEECAAMRHANAELRVIVVDNASDDGTRELLRASGSDGTVEVILNDQNVGFARAVNQALEAARGDAVLLLNSDSSLSAEVITELQSATRSGDIGIAGPVVLNPDASIQSCGNSFPTVGGALRKLLRWPENRYPQTAIADVDWVSGCCMLITAEAIERAGHLSDDFFFFGEDVEFCWRVRRAGLRVVVASRASVVHQGGASYGSLNVARHLTAAKRLLFERCFGRARGFAITAIEMMSSSLSLLRAWVVSDREAAAWQSALLRTSAGLLWALARGPASQRSRGDR